MSRREDILGRVREALSVPSDAGVRAESGDGVRDVREARGFLPPGGDSPEERLAIFRALAEKLKAEVTVFGGMDEAKATLAAWVKKEGWTRVGSHHHALTDALLADATADATAEVTWTDDEPSVDELERLPVGISACEALIAQTGSVLITNRGCGGRALSVLPPHHIVIATMDQLLPDMLAGFDVLKERYGDTTPSLISFITGASRTGDIERILVLGAHGPKRLSIWIVGE
ncbi:MAG: LUD domain-containing protein [Verrucomicrobia bacterium]|nr:LUD domain-containing protein [Verrucomicrobiota bacterium]MCH8527012.1 LUD domain-containing protein [Kiritimatiellia bacterium]